MPNLYKKGSRMSNKRFSVIRKKKFQGNQFTAEAETEYVSTSAKKLKNVDYNEIDIDVNSNYVILNFLMIFNFLSDCLKCKSCDGDVTFSRTTGPGLAFKLVIECPCTTRRVPSSSNINHSHEVNRRFMFAMRILGLGLQSINTFCSLMDISHSFSAHIYYAFLDNLLAASKFVFELVQKKAVKEEIELNTQAGQEPLHLTVSGDGSWKKRGSSSLFGTATLIGKYSQKVVDVAVKSAFCESCANWKSKEATPEYDEWKESHVDKCSVNQDSAGKMEIDAMKEMFARSEDLLGVKYVNYIGDGDTKTFKAMLVFDPYKDVIVQKKECVRQVQKRMGTRLRAVNKATKGLCGKGTGKLTDKIITDLTLYYGLAISKHPDSAEKMKQAVWATFHHKCSIDENPQHTFCPEGADSWCKWRVAEANGELASFKHDLPLQKNVQDAIRPVYEALSTDDLMQRCTGGNTQNSNECLNRCIWRLAPKHLHCARQTVEIATYIATNLFNEGYSSILKTMNVLGIPVGMEAKNFAVGTDRKCIQAVEQNTTSAARAARMDKRNEQITQMEKHEAEEGLMYGPEIADRV